MVRRSSEAEEVPDCSGLNGGVISNPPPPMTLRAGPQGAGESSREWGESEALPPPPGLCAWAGYPSVSPPSEGGCRGTECCPFFFAASATPSRGVWGTKLWPFFSSIFDPGHKTPNLASDDLVQNVLNLIKKTGLAAYLGSEEAS